MNQIHEENMKKALLEAKKAYDLKEVPIGCVIVDKNNKVIGKGHNTKETMANPLLHAEIIAIEQAVKVIKDWRLNDCSIYITGEPCMMCTGAIIQARIPNLIYGAKMEKFGNIESLIDINNVKLNHRLNITSGVLKEESQELLVKFFKSLRKD